MSLEMQLHLRVEAFVFEPDSGASHRRVDVSSSDPKVDPLDLPIQSCDDPARPAIPDARRGPPSFHGTEGIPERLRNPGRHCSLCRACAWAAGRDRLRVDRDYGRACEPDSEEQVPSAAGALPWGLSLPKDPESRLGVDLSGVKNAGLRLRNVCPIIPA